MSLFHNLLNIKKISDAAKQGHGYVGLITPGDLAALLPRQRHELAHIAAMGKLPERWSVINGNVVDLARLTGHPGGQAALAQAERRDATALFQSAHALSCEETLARWLQASVVGKVEDFAGLPRPLPGDAFAWNESLSPLANDLREAVRGYFKEIAAERGISLRDARKATNSKWLLIMLLWAVMAVVFCAWLQGSWFGLLSYPFCGALATFHTFHDASHGALSKHAWVNELLTFSGFLIAAPHEWYWQHVAGHHVHTNIAGLDPDSKHANRWVKSELRPSWLFFSLSAIWSIAVPVGLQGLASLRLLAANRAGHALDGFGFVPTPSSASVLALILQRLVCYVLPFWRFGLAWGALWAGYPALVFSLLFMLNTQIAHLNEETHGEVPEKHAECWYRHQLASTTDFGPDSRLHWFLSGGLNLQVEHHLFPTVDHGHLPVLHRIVKRVCAKHEVSLHSVDGYWAGFRSHFQFLRGGGGGEPRPQEMASAWYIGRVWHRRRECQGRPKHAKADHQLSYTVEYAYLDLDELQACGCAAPAVPGGLFAVSSSGSAPACLRFSPKDHLRSRAPVPTSAGELAQHVRELVASHLGPSSPALGHVRLLTMPRRFGYVFNPLSVYYVFDTHDSQVLATVLEVSNTPWNEEVLYVLPAGESSVEKVFHVSPFQPMGTQMEWQLPPPGEHLSMHCKISHHGEPFFEAAVHLHRRDLSAHTLVLSLLRAPFHTYFVQWAIHREAWSLFRKGCTFYSHPDGTKTAGSRAIEFAFHKRHWFAGMFGAAAALALDSGVAMTAAAGVTATAAVAAVMAAPSTEKQQANSSKETQGGSAVSAKSTFSGQASTEPQEVSLNGANNVGLVPGMDKRTWQGGKRPRVCVVGSGIAGNGAAYFLREAYDVTLCERERRTGGHAHTVEVGEGRRVDIGFQVFNHTNYPLLTKLFEELGVETAQSDMSLSIASRGAGNDFEWSSRALFPTWASLLSPASWLRLFEILRFERVARDALAAGNLGDVKLGEWVAQKGFSVRLTQEYLAPMGAALWSCPTDHVLDFPAVTVLGFLENHFMLQRARPKWHTVKHRAEDYVERLHSSLRASGTSILAPTEVACLKADSSGGVRVFDVQGRPVDPEPFDRVVLAVHADQALAILQRSELPPDDVARAEALLGQFRYFANRVSVHNDPRFMPKERACWSAWNALQMPGGVAPVTYWVNRLQPGAVPEGQDIFVTLNAPDGAIAESALLKDFELDHPVLDEHALKAQRGLPSLQGLAGGCVYFCGAWAGHGFHEDGLRSAREMCVALGAELSAWPSARRVLAPLSLPTRLLWTGALLPGLRRMVRKGSLRVVFSDGLEAKIGDGAGKEVELFICSEQFLWRTLLDPGMGLADAYIEGEVDVKPDIIDLFNLMLANKPKNDPASSPMAWSPLQIITPLAKNYYAFLHARRANSHQGSKDNIAAHYDLSNAMFGMFLSRDMTYSAGIFDDEVEALQQKGSNAESDFLEVAQKKKLDRMLDLIELQDGDTVLEIGCGWGSMAIRAAQRCPGLRLWTAVTLSRQQLELASKRVAEAGVAERVRIVFCDYRDVAAMFGSGVFSKVISCEMIEAVGHEYLPGYFAAIDECLKPGGKAAIQAICVPDERYESYRRGSDFIRERIFPGSHLPCLAEIERACHKGCTSLRQAAEHFSVGVSYAKTLREWRRRFAAHEKEVRAEVSTFGEGFDNSFIRRWHYYFAYCEAGFQTGHIDDWQICLQKANSVETGASMDARKARMDGDALHAGRAGLLPSVDRLQELLARPRALPMQVAVSVAQRMLDKGLLPDWAVRAGIRLKLAQKIREELSGCVEKDQAAKLAFVEALKAMPIAICTAEANEQHYEVPAELYHLWLGPRKKYSGCIYPEGAAGHLKRRAAELLPAAEERALAQYIERAGITDGMAILDLGCGWGSASLYLAEQLPNAFVVGVSNSNSQRGWILSQAEQRGLQNLSIVTCDVSKVPLRDAALPALAARRPEAEGFDRVVSVEMMEHMKNYDILLERVSEVLRPGGQLFVHIFVHTRFAYHFVAKTEADWMARYFFAGGTMPSADLLFYFQRNLHLKRHWHVNGKHYQLTAEGWLQNMDKHARRIMELLKQTYPEGTEVMWFHRWRAFFMACAELWGYKDGNEWIVAHYLFEKPS